MKNCSSSNLKGFWGKDYALKIFLALVLAVSLLFSIVNVTGAWFTDSSADKKTINTVIKTGEANLNVYQEDSTGTQTLLSKSLPTGYTQLEYIESTGTQNISTNYVWKNEKTKVYIDATVTTFKAPSTLFGAQYWDDADSHSIWMYCPYDIDGSGNYAVLVGKTSSLGYISVTKNTRFNAEFSTTSDKKLTVKFNGATAVSGTYTGSMVVNSSRGINLFSSSGSGNNQYEIMGGMRCYAFKMWDNDILVRDLVPAKNASGTIGMYDLVEDKFYTNASTGTFTAGAEQIAGTGVSLAYNTTNKTNNKVTLNDLPAEYTQLKLLLKNEDLGSSFGIRYKVNFYATTLNGKVLLTSSIAGMTAPSSSTNGFVYNSTDGYYYYKNSSGQNVMFEPATSSAVTSKYLMQSFSIEFSSVANLLGGNSISMEILVESVNV